MGVWVVAECLLCAIAFGFRKKLGFLGYQVAVAAAYLLALCFEQTLDFTMSAYFAFAVIPYIRCIKLPTLWEVALALYLAVHAVIGIVFNGFVNVVSLLIIHYLGPLCLVYIFCNVPRGELFPSPNISMGRLHSYVEKALLAIMCVEAVVGVISIAMSPDGRLMLNYQCVSGCLACICIVLIAFQLRDKYHKTFDYICLIYCIGWAFASGTRGYIVLSFVMAVAVLATQKDVRSKVLLVCLVGIAACFMAFCNPDFFAQLVNDSGMTKSTGRRGYENQWFMNLFANEGPLKELFGIGIGTKFSNQGGAIAAFAGVGADDYSYRMILGNTTLHNFWFTMMLATGVVGAFLYVAVFVRFARALLDNHLLAGTSRRLCMVFMAAYAFVLWYRWTATGGIFESVVLCALLAFWQFAPSIAPEKDTSNRNTHVPFPKSGQLEQ